MITGLRERQEEKLKALSEFPEQAPHPIIETDSRAAVTYQNLAAKELFGDLSANPEALKAVTGMPAIMPLLRRDPRKPYRERIEWKGRVYDVHAHFIVDRERVRFILIDASDAIRNEELGQRFRQIADSVAEFLTLIDANYVYLAANEAYCRAHRLNPDAIIGRKVSQIWGEKVFNNVIKGHLERCFMGQTVCYQIWIDFPGIGRRYFDVSYYPHKNEKGETLHAVVLSRDITHVIESEERLRQLEKQDVAARMAKGLVAELERPVKLARAGASGELAASLDRAETLLAKLRTFYEPRRERDGQTDVAVLLGELLDKIVGSEKPKITVVREFEKVPVAPIDRSTLEQVLRPVIQNAIDAVREAPERRITAEVWQEGESIRIGISDTGKGVAFEERERLFEPFYTTKREHPGLGLSICRNLLGSYGATIDVRSEEGTGAQATVTIPFSTLARPAINSSRLTETIAPARRAHVVVIDSDSASSGAVQKALADENDVIVFSKSREALEFFERVPYVDAVFCDLVKPDSGGIELFQAIERRWPELAARVVFLAGGLTKPDVERFLHGKPNRKVSKPVTPAALKKCVAELISNPAP